MTQYRNERGSAAEKALRLEAIKAIESDPVVKEISEVLVDHELMTVILPAIAKSWGVRERMSGRQRIAQVVGIGGPARLVSIDIDVVNPLSPEQYVLAQSDVSILGKGVERMLTNYKESIMVDPIYWAIRQKHSDGPICFRGSEHDRERRRVFLEGISNPHYGKNKCGMITFSTSDLAEEVAYIRLMVGYDYVKEGFELAVVESSPRTEGKVRLNQFSSYPEAKAFFALPYEQQEWGGMTIWSDYFRLKFKMRYDRYDHPIEDIQRYCEQYGFSAG